MEVLILPNPEAVARRCADIVESQITKLPDSVLGLATGSSPIGLYEELILRHRDHGLSFREVTTFNLDEYIGIPADHPQSYRTFMNRHLFSEVDIDIENTHVPDGMAENPLQVGPDYEAMISEAGGIDLQILGIGTDGHIGFNEQTSSLRSRTRVKTLTRQTLTDNSRFFKPDEFQPKLAITMGIATILEARRILLIATGEGKAEAIRNTVEGALTAFVPASALQLHERATIVIDEAAASKLQLRDYYHFVGELQDDLVKVHRPSDWVSREAL
ncbi:glucosamine-6-phosphate deaminase [Verrucomicrobiales bacterium BCK34]|nr:glucosamine-6-phosphate deaminase [Verrucomicrobiales bacterium BCK34]